MIKDSDKLISIIVPIYNIEIYLSRCVDSIINQCYTNLEIILVDDGSTDSCGMMCDSYKEQDSRIVVIHKANGGLSSARNAGLDVAQGEYIGFVDGDDYIEPDMYEKLYYFCSQNELDIVCARFCECIDGKDHLENYTGTSKIDLGSRLYCDALLERNGAKITSSVWDRLYKKEMFEGIRFPEGKLYEDIVITPTLFLNAGKCGYIDSLVYHYTIRSDSIMGLGGKNKKEFSDRILSDFIPQAKTKIDLLYENKQSEAAEQCRFSLWQGILKFYCQVYKRTEYKQQKEKLFNLLKQDLSWTRKYMFRLGNRQGISMLLAAVSPELYCRIYCWIKG